MFNNTNLLLLMKSTSAAKTLNYKCWSACKSAKDEPVWQWWVYEHTLSLHEHGALLQCDYSGCGNAGPH